MLVRQPGLLAAQTLREGCPGVQEDGITAEPATILTRQEGTGTAPGDTRVAQGVSVAPVTAAIIATTLTPVIMAIAVTPAVLVGPLMAAQRDVIPDLGVAPAMRAIFATTPTLARTELVPTLLG
jgi:hypothetical protein